MFVLFFPREVRDEAGIDTGPLPALVPLHCRLQPPVVYTSCLFSSFPVKSGMRLASILVLFRHWYRFTAVSTTSSLHKLFVLFFPREVRDEAGIDTGPLPALVPLHCRLQPPVVYTSCLFSSFPVKSGMRLASILGLFRHRYRFTAVSNHQ